MKKTSIIAGILMTFTAIATHAQNAQKAAANATVDSIESKYKLVAMPTAMTVDQVFPVIGEYKPTNSDVTSDVKIGLDEQNKGIVWVEGLPQGKIKAMLRKSPATYKVPAQKTADGKDVPEGTLIFDKDTKTLSICLGKAYNDANPAAAFAPVTTPEEQPVVAKTGKHKKAMAPAPVKPWVFVGTKIEHPTAMSN